MRSLSNAFRNRLNEDGLSMCELIDVEMSNGVSFRWTTNDVPVFYTHSGALTEYVPFPGSVPAGIEESSDLGVSVVGFTMANTGGNVQEILKSNDFKTAQVYIGRIWIDTPDMGRMEIYRGQIGDFSHNRQVISGQARNQWGSVAQQWPFLAYQDTCVWKFGGPGCGFNTASITIDIASVSITKSNSTMIVLPTGTLAAYAEHRFDFGRLTVTAGVNSGQVRTIREHIGDTLKLSHPLPVSSFSDMAVAIHPGCRKRAAEDCRDLYANDLNFLGFPFLPIQEQAF